MRHDNFIPSVTIRTRGRLPHWYVDNATYFVTFGLRDSIPTEVVRGLFLEREHLLRSARNAVERVRIARTIASRFELEFDEGRGSCVLRRHGGVVAEALKHFDGARYALHAWCVMPNHVHVLLDLACGAELPRVVHSWKSYTAHAIGRGTIWQREYFDRVIRSPQEFGDTLAYIRANPIRAGLVDWPWVG